MTLTQHLNKADKTYGLLGDKLELISNQHGDVLIVMNKKMERFCLNKEKIKEYATT